MITGHDATRLQYLGGDVTPSFALTVRNSHLDWTWATRAVLVGAAYEGDDQHALADIHFPWGDGAVVGPTSQWGWAWSPRQWNATDENWYIGIANNASLVPGFSGDATQIYTLAGGPLILQKSRPGVWGTAATSVLRIFYISTAQMLDWTDVDLADLATAGGTWCGSDDGAAVELRDANDVWLDAESYTVSPVSATEVFVFGWQAPLVWVCRFVYSSGNWTPGAVHYIKFLKALPYNAIFNCDATNVWSYWQSTISVLVAPTAARTVQTLTYYENIYSAPNWVHAPPESSDEGGQRVWVHSLTTIGTRVWAVVSTDVDGGKGHYYARRTHLYSVGEQSRGWNSWRDEGYFCAGSWPGKVELAYGHVSCRSAASWATAPETWRLTSATATGVTGVTAVRSLTAQHALSGPGQLEAELLEFSTLLEPGNRMDYSLGVGSDKVPIFQGYIDAVARETVLGEEVTKVLARGPLSRLTGETSFVPLTTLEWLARGSWWTRFVDIDKVPVNGLATAHGDLWAERSGDYGILRCLPTADQRPAVATAPQPIDTDDCCFSCIMQVDGGWEPSKTPGIGTCGVTFWHDDPKHLSTAYWLVDVATAVGETYSVLRLWQVTPGVDANGADIGLFTLKQTTQLSEQDCILGPGDKLLWQVILRSGFIQVQISQYPYPSSGAPIINVPQALLTYNAWQPRTGEPFAPAPSWLVGVSLSPTSEGRVWEFSLCDGWPLVTARDALEMVSELAGVSLTWPMGLVGTTYYQAGTGMTVQSLDCVVTATSAGSGLVIGDYTLLLYPTHAVLVRYRWNGSSNDTIYSDSRIYGRTVALLDLVRVVAAEDCISLYHGERLLCAFFVDLPEVVGFVTVHGQAVMTWQACSDLPLLGGLSWGFQENAASVLGNLLRGRRVYLVEWPDGAIYVKESTEGTAAFPLGSYNNYRHVTVRELAEDDLRNQVSVLGVLAADYDVSAAYLLNPAGFGGALRRRRWTRRGCGRAVWRRRRRSVCYRTCTGKPTNVS